MPASPRSEQIAGMLAGLDEIAAGAPGHIVELVGEAGIGKSTVARAVVAHATAARWRVWAASPTAAEAELPWTGLAQLLTDVDADDLGGLVAGERAQLDRATSVRRDEPVEPELVAFGLASLVDSALRRADTPLLVVVDDHHWLDRASAGALAYALRRIVGHRAAALLASRPGRSTPIEPARLAGESHSARVELVGLEPDEVRQAVSEATGLVLSRAAIAKLCRRTGGNPLYAIELAREIVAGRASVDTVALPPSLTEIIGARVRALPLTTRRALGAAAMSASPTIGSLATVLPGVDVIDALEPAEATGVVVVRDGPSPDAATVAFTHPLLAVAAEEALTAADRRRVHVALADLVDDPVERVPHLIASGVLRGEAAAAALEAAGRHALERGAVDAAVELTTASLTATPGGERTVAGLERRFLLAQCQADAGDLADAHATLCELDVLLGSDGTARATGGVLLELHRATLRADVVPTAVTEGLGAGVDTAWRALDIVVDPAERFDLHALVVRLLQFEDVAKGLEIAESVFGPDTEHRGFHAAQGALQLLGARVLAGVAVDVDAVARQVGAVDADGAQRVALRAALVEPMVWTDHPDSVAMATEAVAAAEPTGLRPRLLQALNMVGFAQFVRGDWDGAERALRRIAEMAVDNAYTQTSLSDLAVVLAGRGDPAGAEALFEAIDQSFARTEPGPSPRLWVAARRGEVALATGDSCAADELVDAERIALGLGMRSVRTLRFRRSLVEALVLAGRDDEAHSALVRLEADAARSGVVSALGEAAAAAGTLLAAGGDHDAAATRFAEAIDVQRRCGLDYELARTLLAAGRAARRARRRGDAREHLLAARAMFETMGASAWVGRCDDEINRLGGRREAPANELTASERRVAEQAAAGQTNSEIAIALFVSVRTVESHLSRVYRKLGVRSRAALAALVGTDAHWPAEHRSN